MKEKMSRSRHPEDLIFEVKAFVNQLSEVQEERYNSLCKKLGMNEKGRDWLFDYVHNCDEPLCFDEYLAKYGVSYEQCVVRSRKTGKKPGQP